MNQYTIQNDPASNSNDPYDMNIMVLVSQCTPSADMVFGPSRQGTFTDMECAMAAGKLLSSNGISVIVRPTYNEVSDSGENFFREWRSFNGGSFVECRWSF